MKDALEIATAALERIESREGILGSRGAARRAREALAAMRAAPGCSCSTPWPGKGITEALVEAAIHLLDDHDCDMHGHEEVRAAIDTYRRERAGLR